MTVPCNGCTLCCKGDAVRLLPEDNPDLYITEKHPNLPNALMLAHQKNGDCIYLKNNGCSIHSYKPMLCKSMDCRNIAKNVTFTQARKLHKKGLLDLMVWKKGRDLLKNDL